MKVVHLQNPSPKKEAPAQDAHAWLAAPGFITFTDVTPEGADAAEFVICNEATGKFFLANRPTVQFFAAIKESGSVRHALAKSGIPPQQGDTLVKRLVQSGLLVRSGETQSEVEKKAAPLESKLISLRWDLIDAARVTDAFGWLGRVLYGPVGYLAWAAMMVTTVQVLLANSEKVGLSLRQIFDASWVQLAIFVGLYVGLKVVHEMGHALAYRTMCQQEGLEPGPIRMGISIFAFTPFPFTDVTGAWRLRSVFRRVMIGAGGIYFETWIIALLTLFWANTQSGMFQTIILQVAVFAGLLALLFNLNPAIKLDGYYMLTDYLRKPNLSGRASQAARGFAAKMLGAKMPPIIGADLTYWVLSYAYRWTIFGGIFWLIYKFDPRLAPVAAALVFMTLIGRPLFNTLKFAWQSGIRPVRFVTVVGLLGAVGLLLALPFPDRILMPGQMRLYETQFVEPAEMGQLRRADDGSYALFNPSISQQMADLGYRQTMLENLQRASFSSGSEQASLTAELSSLRQMRVELERRQDRLSVARDEAGIWTPLAAEVMQDAWVGPNGEAVLGAQSRPIAPQLLLRLDQALLERDIPIGQGATLDVRAVHDPTCAFTAQLLDSAQSGIAQNDRLILRAGFAMDQHPCSAEMRNGSAVVAKLVTKPRSVLRRLQFGASRLLQDRLPIDLN